MISFLKRHQIVLASLLLCLFSLHLVSTDRGGTGGTVLVKGLVDFALTPFQTAMLRTEESIKSGWKGYVYLVGLKEENEELKEDIRILVEENNRLKEDVQLNIRLKELVAFKESAPFSTVAAEILGFNRGGGWTRTVSLNKGAVDGIERDMTLLSPDGVVGRIVDVSRSVSTALLVTDPRSNIDVILQRTRVKGVVEGYGSEGLLLKYVRQLDDVQVGDRVVTAGHSGIFPKGLLVGEVRAAEKGEDNFFKHIEVQPAANLKKLEEVLIVTDNGNPLTNEKQGRSLN
jgi:rod shape-determining protein MreC